MMKKRILSLCLAIVMLLSVLPMAAFAAEAPEMKVSLTLTDSIAINFKASADDIDAAAFEKVEFYNGKTLLKTVSQLPAADANGMYVFSYTDIAPHMMGYTVTAKLYAGDLNLEKTASVKNYCKAILNDVATYGDDLAVLAMELLDYGTAAQKYLDSTVANAELVNCGAAETYPEIYALSKNELLSLSSVKAVGTEIAEPAVVWTGAGLYLQDAISIRYKFTADSVDGLTLKVVSGGSTWTVSDFYATEDGAWYAYFDSLNPNQLRKTVVATVYDSQDQAVSNSLTYSVESYVADISEQSDDADLKTLVYQMLCYGDATANWVDTASWSTVVDVDFETGTLDSNYIVPFSGTATNGTLATDKGYNSNNSLQVDSGNRPKYYKAGSIPAGWYRISGYVYLNGADASKVSIQPWVMTEDGKTNKTDSYTMASYIVGSADANGWSYFEVDIQHLATATNYQVVFNNSSGKTVYFDNFKYEKYLGEGQPEATKAPMWTVKESLDFETGTLADNFVSQWNDSTNSFALAEDVGHNSSKSLQINNTARAKFYKAGVTLAAGWYRISGYVKLNGADPSKVNIQVWEKKAGVSGNNTPSYALNSKIIGQADANGWSYFEIDVQQPEAQPTFQIVFNNNAGSGVTVYFDDVTCAQYLGANEPVYSVMPADLATPAESTEPEETVPETTVPEVTEPEETIPEETEPEVPVWESVADVDFETGTLADNYFNGVQGSGAAGVLAEDIGYNSSKSLQVNNTARPKYYKAGSSIAAGWYRISGYVYLNGADASKLTIQPWVKNASNTNDTTEYSMANCIVGPADVNGWSYFELDVYQHAYQTNYQVVFNNNKSSGKTIYIDNFKYEKYLGEGQPEPTPRPEWQEMFAVNFEDGVTPEAAGTDKTFTGTDVSLVDDTTRPNSTKAVQVGALSRAKFSKSVGTNGLPAGYYKLSGYVKLGDVPASNASFTIWAYQNTANGGNTVKPVVSDCIVGETVNGWTYFEVIFNHGANYSLIQFYLANGNATTPILFDDVAYSKYIGEDTLTLTPG